MAIARIFFGLILIFVFVAFSLKNMEPISVDLYFMKTPDLPLFVWLFFSALFGVIVAWLVAISEQLRMGRELRKERKEKKELEDKIEKLKKDVDGLEERLSRRVAMNAVQSPETPAETQGAVVDDTPEKSFSSPEAPEEEPARPIEGEESQEKGEDHS